MGQEKIIIGCNEPVELPRLRRHVPAKIDTGADTSSIWVSNIRVDKHGVLRFCLFGEGSPYYTGKVIKRDLYSVGVVRSASGHEQIRYRTKFSLRIAGKRIRATFTLSDRSKNRFPILIGRRTLSGKFIVDVSRRHYHETKVFTEENRVLNKELEKNAYDFYKKHYKHTGLSVRKTT
ncbi:ATP-dependent zinc protease family protein [Streptomyces caniscabiei]|uniref:ATP-dependent zinc protease family protein n=1 Tax=Streptomyces caniscabiei TaxID=2746961 RepID=UPI0038D3D9BE